MTQIFFSLDHDSELSFAFLSTSMKRSLSGSSEGCPLLMLVIGESTLRVCGILNTDISWDLHP